MAAQNTDNKGEKQMIRVIGIDFGTSSTYMNVKRYNPDNLLEDSFNYIAVSFDHGESIGVLASVIRENGDGTFDFGRTANEEVEGSVIHRNFKMDLENPDDEKREHAMLLTRKLFEYLYESYQQQINQLGDATDRVETYISYPVKWQENTVDFMLKAASDAGFPNVSGMDEATAAISTVISRNFDNLLESGMLTPDKKNYLLLVDMGAGTTDLALCKYYFEDPEGAVSADKLKIEIVSNWPVGEDEPTFGGREIDEVLTCYVEDYLKEALPAGLSGMASAIVRVGNSIKLWKENMVSPKLNKNEIVNTCGFIRAYISAAQKKFPVITRESFEQLVDDLLKDYAYLLEKCLDDASAKDSVFSDNGLDMVILAGGHSSWYFAKGIIDHTVEGYLNHPALQKIYEKKERVFNLPNPQSTVALGLIYNKMMSTMQLKMPMDVTDEWIDHLKDAPLHPRFVAAKKKNQVNNEIYNEAAAFTREHPFNMAESIQKHISVFDSNEALLNSFRYKRFFTDKPKEFCFCVDKKTGSPSGLAVSPSGIYYETRMSKSSITWEDFLLDELVRVGSDSIRIQLHEKGYYDTLPVNWQCLNLTYDYLKGMQDHLRKRFPDLYRRVYSNTGQ